MSVITGRIDEQGRALLPVVVIASDGMEVELETTISLDFDGYLAVNQQLASNFGWRSLGARKVLVGFETRLVDHYIGTVLFGNEPRNVVVLGGINKAAVMGQRLLAGKKLTLNFASGQVLLE